MDAQLEQWLYVKKQDGAEMKTVKYAMSILIIFLAFYIFFSLHNDLGVVISALLFALESALLSEFRYRYENFVKYLEKNIGKQNRSEEIENLIRQMKQVKKHSRIKWIDCIIYFLIYVVVLKYVLTFYLNLNKV